MTTAGSVKGNPAVWYTENDLRIEDIQETVHDVEDVVNDVEDTVDDVEDAVDDVKDDLLVVRAEMSSSSEVQMISSKLEADIAALSSQKTKRRIW